MRKFIILGLIAAVSLPGAVSAQSRNEIRHDRADVREERRELREAREELRDDRRDRQRSRYVSPYRNWNYNRVRAGYQLRPAFYGSRYYVSDFSRRGLARPGRNQQWIRYGDDLLLVNVRTGRVLQAIYNRY